MPPQSPSTHVQQTPPQQAPDDTARIEDVGLSDETRPVPRDRGPVGPDVPGPATAAETPATPATTATAADDPEPAAADGPEPAAATAEPAVEDGETQDIRFAPGEAPGELPPPAADADEHTGVLPPVPADTPDGASPHGTAPGGDDGDGSGPDAGTPDPRRPRWRRPAVVTPVAAVGVLAAAYGVDLLATSGDVPRNTVVAGVDIGGLTPAAAAGRLETDLAPRVAADHVVLADDVEATLAPATAGSTLDVAVTVEEAAAQAL